MFIEIAVVLIVAAALTWVAALIGAPDLVITLIWALAGVMVFLLAVRGTRKNG
jgi:hypothetical protein